MNQFVEVPSSSSSEPTSRALNKTICLIIKEENSTTDQQKIRRTKVRLSLEKEFPEKFLTVIKRKGLHFRKSNETRGGSINDGRNERENEATKNKQEIH